MAIVTPEEKRRAASSTPQSRFQQEPPGMTGMDWITARGILDLFGRMIDQGNSRDMYGNLQQPQQGSKIGEATRPVPSSVNPTRQEAPVDFRNQTGRTPFQVIMENINRNAPAPQAQQGLPFTPDVLALLAGGEGTGGEVPMPNFGGGSQATRQPYREMPEFQSPENVQAFTGGDLTGFLSLPDAVSFDIPQLSRLQTFGLRPEQVSQALNTELSYRQAQQQAQQQRFSNRVTQLGIASGMDEAAAQAFSQRLIDEQRNVSNQQARFNYEHDLTPMENMMKQAEISAELAQYKHKLSMEELNTRAQIALASGKLTDREKMKVEEMWKIVREHRNSAELVDIFEAANSGNMENVMKALQSGALKPRTIELIGSIMNAADVLIEYEQIEKRSDIGLPDNVDEIIINYDEYIRSLQEGK